ncbi:MAG: hypothetical protein WB714_17470 [Candidatus Sulfotelmatobacter sp.]
MTLPARSRRAGAGAKRKEGAGTAGVRGKEEGQEDTTVRNKKRKPFDTNSLRLDIKFFGLEQTWRE